jgi:hypothetical protein
VFVAISPSSRDFAIDFDGGVLPGGVTSSTHRIASVRRAVHEAHDRHHVRTPITSTREYAAIQRWYGERTAVRSGIPLIQHVDEGLVILTRIGASDAAARAFCVHPLVQADADLAANAARIGEATEEPYIAMLAIEYRHVANAALSSRALVSPDEISLSPLADVNAMLAADKVQNRKDFLRYHRDTHPRRVELARYFELWLVKLAIDETRYGELAAGL